MFSGEYARSCNSSLLVAYSWSIFTVLQHSLWIVIWLWQFQTVQNYRHASSISLQFFTDGGGFVDFVAPSYPNSPLHSRLLHCSSLFANFPLKIVGWKTKNKQQYSQQGSHASLPLKNMLRGPGDIRRSSQPMRSECRSSSSVIGELTAHAKNWLPISYDLRRLRRTGWRL